MRDVQLLELRESTDDASKIRKVYGRRHGQFKTLYILELAEHDEEAEIKRLQNAVAEGEPLDLV